MTTSKPPPAGATLAEILALRALRGAQVIPPDADITRVVRSVAIAEPGGPAAPDALVIAVGVPQAPPEGCAATISRRRPRKAQDVPAIVLPPMATWGVVIDALVAALASGGAAARITAARQALRAPLIGGEGIVGVTEAASTLLGAPVAVLDEFLDVQATHDLDTHRAAALEEAISRARGHGPTLPLGPFVGDDALTAERVRLSGPRGAVGALVVWLPSPAAAPERAVLAEVVEALLVARAREDVRTETEVLMRGELIDELLAGEPIGRDAVVRRGRMLGTDLDGGAIAFAARLTDPHDQARTVSDPRILRRLANQLRGALDRDWPRAMIDWHAGALLGFLPTATAPVLAAEESRDAQAVEFATRLLSVARPAVPGFALTIAVSRHTPDPELLGRALGEANLALEIAVRLGRTDRVTTFEDTGTYTLLFQVMSSRPADLTAFYESTLAPAVAYDRQNSTNLVHTLATYLELDGNLAGTAAALFTHRHTIRYRLGRLAEITGHDVSRTDDRETLSLALKAMRLLGRSYPRHDQHATEDDQTVASAESAVSRRRTRSGEPRPGG